MRRYILFGLAALSLVVVLTACGGSTAPSAPVAAAAPTGAADAAADAASIESITLHKDSNGEAGDEVQSFTPADHVMQFVIKTSSVKVQPKFKAELLALGDGGQADTKVVDKEFDALLANTFTFTVTLPKDWPTGKYRVNVYINNTFAKSRDFEVK